MVFRCLRKLDSECMEVGRSCREKHAPSMYLTYTEKIIRQISSHAWGREVGLVLKQQRYAVAYFFWAHAGFCTQTLSSARNWHSLFCTRHLLNWEALFAVIFRGDLRPGHDPKRPLALWRRFESLDQLLTIIKHIWNTVLSRSFSNFGVILTRHTCDILWRFSWDFQAEGLNWVCRSWNVCGRRSYQSLVRALHKLAFCDLSWKFMD